MTPFTGKLTTERERVQRSQRAYEALEKLLQRALQPAFTGSISVEVDVNQGGITDVRVHTREKA